MTTNPQATATCGVATRTASKMDSKLSASQLQKTNILPNAQL